MNKLKTGKGALKDYHRCLADEYDDYAEEPEYYDPISHFTNSNGSQIKTASGKLKTAKRPAKVPKFKPDFNFVDASGGVFERHFGERLAMFLGVSDVLKLLRTCRYLYKIFSSASIWRDFLSNYYGINFVSTDVLSSINIMQYTKYLRCARIQKSSEQKKKNDGIIFDTLIIEKDMRKEDKFLVRHIVDSVTARSQKTIDTITKVALTGTFTEDIKISWIKDLNQIVVWVAGYHIQTNLSAYACDNLSLFACILFNEKYKEESLLIQKAYFLTDRYFVIEFEETNEEEGLCGKTFEAYMIEPEHDWFEKKHISLCNQVLKERFVVEKAGNVMKVKNIGDFLVFVLERENNKLWIQIFDANDGKCLYQSEDLSLEAGLNDVVASRSMDKSSFSLYLLDKELEIYMVTYSLEPGVTLKKIDQKRHPMKKRKKKNCFRKNKIKDSQIQ